VNLTERVARAIWERRRAFSLLEHNIPLEPWGDGSIPQANGVVFEAMAAIDAVKQSDEMRQLCDAAQGWSYP
jgi:cell division septal protein FtsQ